MKHFKNKLKKTETETSYFNFGNAIELKLTDSDMFEKKICFFDDKERPVQDKDFRDSENKKWKNDFLDKNKNKIVLNKYGEESEFVINEISRNFVNHPSAFSLLKNCNTQTSIWWDCEDSGLRLKTRPDFWKPKTEKRDFDIVIDLKSSKSSLEDGHMKDIQIYNYPIQAIMQIEGLQKAGLIGDYYKYFWIFVSKEAPYNVEVYEFDSEDINKTKEAYTLKKIQLAEAIDNDFFENYNPKINQGIKNARINPWYFDKLYN